MREIAEFRFVKQFEDGELKLVFLEYRLKHEKEWRWQCAWRADYVEESDPWRIFIGVMEEIYTFSNVYHAKIAPSKTIIKVQNADRYERRKENERESDMG